MKTKHISLAKRTGGVLYSKMLSPHYFLTKMLLVSSILLLVGVPPVCPVVLRTLHFSME